MREFKKQIVLLCIGSAVLNALVVAVSLFVGRCTLSFLLGLAVGTAFELVIFLWMIHSTKRTLDRTGKAAQIYSGTSYFFRYLCAAGVMLLAVYTPQISFWGVIIPMFYTKIVFVFIYTLGKESWR